MSGDDNNLDGTLNTNQNNSTSVRTVTTETISSINPQDAQSILAN